MYSITFSPICVRKAVMERGELDPYLRLAIKIARAFGRRLGELSVYGDTQRRDRRDRYTICSNKKDSTVGTIAGC
jgi:hypothetical protein